MSEDEYIWMFKNKVKMILYPKQAFSAKFQSHKDKLSNAQSQVWQPEHLYIQFSSNSGCQFNLSAVFVQEEEAAAKRANHGSTNNEKALSSLIRDQVK